MWPNFRSPLLWDVFAVSTYFTVSLLFWYMGMIPTSRRSATGRTRSRRSRTASSRWAGGGSAAGTGTATSGRTCCSRALDAAGAVGALGRVVRLRDLELPGWHTTIFPPYFVAGAIFGGFAMVLLLLIPARELCPTEGPHHAAAPGEHGQDHPR
jgi:Ni/Fe-hydrogenase subunit HybB-like protein